MPGTFALINQNCRLAARLVSDSIDRPLSPLERIGLAVHVAGCRSCRRYRQQVRMIDRLIGEAAGCEGAGVTLSAIARARITERLGG